MSQKKVKQSSKPVEDKVLPSPVHKKYILLSSDAGHSTSTYSTGKVTIVHNEHAYVQVIDTGDGYQIIDVSPRATNKHSLDYAVAADLFAALKIFYHNADKSHGEYWTIFSGEKL